MPSYNSGMKKHLAIIAFLACPNLAMADNFAECLLDKLPGIQNDNSAGAAYQVCIAEHPERYADIEQGSGRGIFGYQSGAECALKKARDTRSMNAAGMIRVACNRLYNDPATAESTQESCESTSPGPWCSFR